MMGQHADVRPILIKRWARYRPGGEDGEVVDEVALWPCSDERHPVGSITATCASQPFVHKPSLENVKQTNKLSPPRKWPLYIC